MTQAVILEQFVRSQQPPVQLTPSISNFDLKLYNEMKLNKLSQLRFQEYFQRLRLAHRSKGSLAKAESQRDAGQRRGSHSSIEVETADGFAHQQPFRSGTHLGHHASKGLTIDLVAKSRSKIIQDKKLHLKQ